MKRIVPRSRVKPGSPPPARTVPSPVEEAALVAACLAGSAAAWRHLLSRYESAIYSISRRHGLGDEEAAEVFQNVCLALFRGLPRLKQAAGLTRWVLVTTHRQARDVARRQRREVPDPDDLLARSRPDPRPLADDLLNEIETRVEVRAAMEKLGERCAQLLQWLYLDQAPPSYKEVAQRLGVPEGTVGPTRARCLARLRQIIEKTRRGRTK
jgi:RNA polymerase sigma factor (sigma-70 family)